MNLRNFERNKKTPIKQKSIFAAQFRMILVDDLPGEVITKIGLAISAYDTWSPFLPLPLNPLSLLEQAS
jgi:hypothetical protein